MPRYTALVTVLAILFYFYTAARVPQARRRFGLKAPVMMTGSNPEFDRIFRVQMNTLEWLPIFLPLLWMFAFSISDIWAAALGVVWVAARAWYMVGYTQAPQKRAPGFGLQVAVCVVLLIGVLIGIFNSFAHGG